MHESKSDQGSPNSKLCFYDLSLRGRFEVAASTTVLEIIEGAGFRNWYMNIKVTSAYEAVLRSQPLLRFRNHRRKTVKTEEGFRGVQGGGAPLAKKQKVALLPTKLFGRIVLSSTTAFVPLSAFGGGRPYLDLF